MYKIEEAFLGGLCKHIGLSLGNMDAVSFDDNQIYYHHKHNSQYYIKLCRECDKKALHSIAKQTNTLI